MNDLSLLLDNRQVEINEFFEISLNEKKSNRLEDFCNIEIPFKKEIQLPVFSDQQLEHKILNSFESFHSYEEEMAAQINKRDKEKPADKERKYETNHKYIDFTYTIIGEKIKNLSGGKLKSKGDIRFNDLYYSEYMLKVDKNNYQFYLQESVQKIIDF